jgi:hypothetical protein
MADFNLHSTTDTPEQVKQVLDMVESGAKEPKPIEPKPEEAAAEPEAKVETPAAEAKPVTPPAKTQAQLEEEEETSTDPKVVERRKARHRSAQERINAIRREMGDVERERDELRRRLEADRRTTPPERVEEDPDKPVPFAEPKPVVDNFDSVPEYADAVAEWAGRKTRYEWQQEQAVERRRIEASQRTREDQEIISRYNGRVEDFRKTHADFDAVIAKAVEAQLPLPPIAQTHIRNYEHGPEMLYILAQNPEMVQRLASLPHPALVMAFLGRIEERIESARNRDGLPPNQPARPAPVVIPAQGQKPPSPPPPISPVGGGPTSTIDTLEKAAETGNYRQYSELRKRGARR